MRYHRQLIKHDPANGQWGDCFRTCIACLLDLDCPAQVPHVMHGVTDDAGVKAALDKMNKWLADVWGLKFVDLPFTADGVSPKRFMESAGRYLGIDQRYILTADGPLGVAHSVICKGDELEHCPAGRGLDDIMGPVEDAASEAGFYWLGLLVKVV